jgi:YesN/AraC family two-component response regulator
MSGYSMEVNGQEVLDLGARDFLAKPFSKSALLASLGRVMAE